MKPPADSANRLKDHRGHEAVVDQVTVFELRCDPFSEWGLAGDLGPKDIAGRDAGHAVDLGDAIALGPLSRTGRRNQDGAQHSLSPLVPARE